MSKNTFTPELLEQHFTKNEWKKGSRIFNDKGVKTCALDGEIIRGVVFSERSRLESYLTRLVLNIKNDGFASSVIVMSVAIANMEPLWLIVLFMSNSIETALPLQIK